MRQEILVVEDEPDIRGLVVLHLEREGFRCRTVANGLDAVREAKARRPDLIVLDLMLPGLGGLEVCRRLRSDHETAGVPIIMLTAKADEIDRVVGLELGADDYVAKPFSPKELVARARAVLRRTRPVEGPSMLSAGPLALDSARHVVTLDQGVRPPPGAAGVRGTRPLPRAPPQPGVGLRARRRDRVAHRRRARPPAAREAR
jgi:DNA-binding response OmpR family regulator